MSCVDPKAGGRTHWSATPPCDAPDGKKLVLALEAQPVTVDTEGVSGSERGFGQFGEAFGKSSFELNSQSGLCRSVQSLHSESASTRLCANGAPPAVANTGDATTDEMGATVAVSIQWK